MADGGHAKMIFCIQNQRIKMQARVQRWTSVSDPQSPAWSIDADCLDYITFCAKEFGHLDAV